MILVSDWDCSWIQEQLRTFVVSLEVLLSARRIAKELIYRIRLPLYLKVLLDV